MEQTNPAKLVTTAVGIAGGSALIAPVAVPALHGIAGIAIVGLGAVAVGSVVYKAAGSFTETMKKNIDRNEQKNQVQKVF
ncbi:MAG: hypothetical protein J7D60_03655 [Prosthecochloris sp.]|nr:hypothetical protein [Prosthecochloris sp.]